LPPYLINIIVAITRGLETTTDYFYPLPGVGESKNPYDSTLAAEGAEELHRKLAEYTLSKLAGLRNFLSLIIYYHGGSEEKMRTWLGGIIAIMLNGEKT